MELEEMKYKMLVQILSNQLVLLDSCMRSKDMRSFACNDSQIDFRISRTLDLLQAVSEVK